MLDVAGAILTDFSQELWEVGHLKKILFKASNFIMMGIVNRVNRLPAVKLCWDLVLVLVWSIRVQTVG